MTRRPDPIREDNARERDIALRPARPSGGPWPLRTHADGATFSASPATHAEYEAATGPTCGAQYGDEGRAIALQGSAGWRVPTCDLRAGHDGSHEDHVLDAPATIAWTTGRHYLDSDD